MQPMCLLQRVARTVYALVGVRRAGADLCGMDGGRVAVQTQASVANGSKQERVVGMEQALKGRELDLAIATKVMGRNDTWGVCTPPRGSVTDTLGRVLPDGYHERTPHYSTDIFAAWRVLEKVNETAFVYLQRTTEDTWPGRPWFLDITDGPQRFSGRADAAPEAICLAALKYAEYRAAHPIEQTDEEDD